MIIPDEYIKKVKSRSTFAYFKGLVARLPLYLKSTFIRRYAITKGATIGKGTVISWNIAKSANSNLIIGEDCAIDAGYIDCRSKVIIGDHVIINKGVEIIRVSHYIDENRTFETRYYPDLHIGDYCWVSSGAKILPQVTAIAKGTICGAFSVIVKNTDENGVYGGNPGKMLKKRTSLHDQVIVASLQGCDLPYYIKARKM